MNDKNVEEIIRKCYLEILKREPDEGGLRYYFELLKNNLIDSEKLREILKNSNEFQELNWPKEISSKCSREDQRIIDFVKLYTMTSPKSLLSIISSVKYVIRENIPGSFVECGVWRGGSMMAVAMALRQLGHMDRDLYLFDTFFGMTKPSAVDVTVDGRIKAMEEFEKRKTGANSSDWCSATLDEVKKAMYSTCYDKNKIHFISGDVKDTLPEKAPVCISILRLDTDWYDSTLHELFHLFPKLSNNGIIIIDDYDFFKGQRKAVDEYFSNNNIHLTLHHIGGGGRLTIK